MDKCLQNFLLKTVAGAGAGLFVGLVLFKRKSIPVWYGAGMGSGMAYV